MRRLEGGSLGSFQDFLRIFQTVRGTRGGVIWRGKTVINQTSGWSCFDLWHWPRYNTLSRMGTETLRRAMCSMNSG